MAWWAWLLISFGAALAVYAAFVCWLVAFARRQDAQALAILVLPFDLVPDVIPVAGQLDDVIVVVLVLRSLIRSGGEPLLREHWPGPVARFDAAVRRTLNHPRT